MYQLPHRVSAHRPNVLVVREYLFCMVLLRQNDENPFKYMVSTDCRYIKTQLQLFEEKAKLGPIQCAKDTIKKDGKELHHTFVVLPLSRSLLSGQEFLGYTVACLRCCTFLCRRLQLDFLRLKL
jgi:hypothetical protein